MISRSKHRSSVEVCADCGASGHSDVPVSFSGLWCSVMAFWVYNECYFCVDPSWASINRGLLLCAECCSVHRSMGRHISHVKSLRQGSWPPSLLAVWIKIYPHIPLKRQVDLPRIINIMFWLYTDGASINSTKCEQHLGTFSTRYFST